MHGDRGVSEARRELQRINSAPVRYAININVADVPGSLQSWQHFPQCSAKKHRGFAPERKRAHFTGKRADISGENSLVFKIDVDGINKIFAVEISANRN